MKQRVRDLIAEQASRSFVGRSDEICRLLKTLEDSVPTVVYLHGIAGIGKSRLLAAFVDRARKQGSRAILLDCRAVEPTEHGFLRALASALRTEIVSTEDAVEKLTLRRARTLLALDHYEVWRLLDSWLRQTFVPQLPSEVRLILTSREPPGPAWSSAPGWQSLLRTMELDALEGADAVELLARAGIPETQATRINRVVRGHPLALTLAASTMGNQQDRVLENVAIQRVIGDLAQLYLADIADPLTQRGLEAACVIRRATIPLLRAMVPEATARNVFDRLRSLPFVHSDADGLHVHDSIKQAIAATLRSADPIKYHEYRRAALSELRSELGQVSSHEFWRYTADMLYLLDNPVIREAFFPSGTWSYTVEPARPDDGAAIQAICARHEGRQAAACLSRWWAAAPQTFSAAYDQTGKIAGFYCLFQPTSIPRKLLQQDPVVKGWLSHLRKDPIPKGQSVLFLRRWLSESAGEVPSAVQAACWLDIKRSYLALRPKLRRVYLTVKDLGAYASAAQTLGFRRVESAAPKLDGHTYHTAMLDFGPSSVDGWLARLGAAELGMGKKDIVDLEGRSLILNGRRVPLTRLEFAVVHYLHERKGKPVARACLIRDVWDHTYDVGSNVVDVVIRSLRKKLGKQSDMIETVTGYGYKLRQDS
ncbi:MAG: winged helix-turn-helix domain-containing protein [Candidatus Acidiferrales bacterium]